MQIRLPGKPRARIIRFNGFGSLCLTHIAVFLAPFLCIFFLLYTMVTQLYLGSVKEHAAGLANQARSNMDLQIQNVYQIAASVEHNSRVSQARVKNRYYDYYLVMQELQKYVGVNHILQNAFLSLNGSELVISHRGSERKSVFSTPGKSGYLYETWSNGEILGALDKVGLQVRPSEDIRIGGHSHRVVTLIQSIPVGSSIPFGSMMFMIDDGIMLRLLNPPSERYGHHIVAADGDGNVLTRSDRQGSADPAAAAAWIRSLGTGEPGYISVGGKRAVAGLAHSKLNGWYYINYILLEDALRDLQAVRDTLLTCTLAVFLAGCLAIFFSVRINYHPIRELLKAVQQKDGIEKRAGNEYQTIRLALDTLDRQRAALSERISTALPAIRAYYLRGLFSRRFASVESFNLEAAPYGVSFAYAELAVSVFVVPGGRTETPGGILESCVRDEAAFPPKVQGYFIGGARENELILISSQREYGALRQYLAGYYSILEERVGRAFPIIVSAPVTGVNGLGAAYSMLVSSVEAVCRTGRTGVVDYRDAGNSLTAGKGYPAQLAHSLDAAIMRRDAAQIRRAAAELSAFISDSQTYLFVARAVLYHAVNLLLHGISQIDTSAFSRYLHAGSASLEALTRAQMAETLLEYAEALCGYIKELPDPEKDRAPIRQVVRYMDENYLDSGFSLQQIADHFGMSASGFSHFFKSNMNVLFKQYLDDLRMERAKILLYSTDYPVSLIAERVGYSNVSSFIRAFRRMTGKTPGECRGGAEDVKPENAPPSRL